MLIAVGSDHRGLLLKNQLVPELVSLGFFVRDYGTRKPDQADYPDYAQRVAKAISKKEVDMGVLICGTGIGMCIAANKFVDVRAVVCYDEFTAKIAKEQYNANCLCVGTTNRDWKQIVLAWLQSTFQEKPRFIRQLEQIGTVS